METAKHTIIVRFPYVWSRHADVTRVPSIGECLLITPPSGVVIEVEVIRVLHLIDVPGPRKNLIAAEVTVKLADPMV